MSRDSTDSDVWAVVVLLLGAMALFGWVAWLVLA